MICPNEYTWSMYEDGEVDADRARELASHLDTCARCGDLARALSEEVRVLVHCLQEVDLQSPPDNPATAASALRTAALHLSVGVFTAAVVFRLGLDAVGGIQLPPQLQWFDPLSLAGQLNLFMNAIVYALNEGDVSMMSTIRNATFAVGGSLCLPGLARLLRRSLQSSVLLLTLILGVAVSPGQATDLRLDDENVTVAAGDIVDDTLVFFGQSITVDGTVTGDLIAFARLVTIRGVVQGSVFSFGQRIEVTGRIEGNMLGVGQTVQVDGETAGNLYAGAQSVTLSDDGEVVGNVVIGAQDGIINGTLGRDLTVGSRSLNIAGAVGGDVLFGGQTFTVQAPAEIGGDLEAHMGEADNFSVDPGAMIQGSTNLELSDFEPNRFTTIAFYLGRLSRLVAAFVSGLALFWVFPAAGRVNLDDPRALFTAGGIGFLAAVATPVAAAIVGITLIGLPVALTAGAAWLLGLYLGKVVIAQFIGRAVLVSGSIAAMGVAGPLLVGLALVFIAISLPYVGGVVNVLLTLIGFGALLGTAYRSWKAPLEAQSQSA